MTQASEHCWYNGRILEREKGAPSVASISFHLGTGVFDGIMAYWNQDHYYMHRAEDHLVRFRQGAACMGLIVPWSTEELLAGIMELLAHEPNGTQYVRPIAFRGGPELWVTGSEGRPVDVSIFTVRTEEHRDLDDPIICELSQVERISSRSIPRQIKVSGAYVNSFFARKTAEKSGADDGLMFDRDGHLTEASAANVFIIFDDRLITPALKADVFPGITRQVILEIARDKGVDICETNLRREDLAGMDGAFLCSTLMEIRAISKLGSQALPTVDLPLYKTVVSAFRTLTHQTAISGEPLTTHDRAPRAAFSDTFAKPKTTV
jgi:branched-chain amino acid aminotransferase